MIVLNVRLAPDEQQRSDRIEQRDRCIRTRESVGPVQVDRDREVLAAVVQPGDLLNLLVVQRELVIVEVAWTGQVAADPNAASIRRQDIAEILCSADPLIVGCGFRTFADERAVIRQTFHMNAVGRVTNVRELDCHARLLVALTQTNLHLVFAAGQTALEIREITRCRIAADADVIRPAGRQAEPHPGIVDRRRVVITTKFR